MQKEHNLGGQYLDLGFRHRKLHISFKRKEWAGSWCLSGIQGRGWGWSYMVDHQCTADIFKTMSLKEISCRKLSQRKETWGTLIEVRKTRGTSKGDCESWANEVGTKPVKSGLLEAKGRKNFKNGGHDRLRHIRRGWGSGHWGYRPGSRGNLHSGSSGSGGHQCPAVVSLSKNEGRGSTNNECRQILKSVVIRGAKK